MINRTFDEIGKSDIDGLVQNATTERRTLEYKAHLPAGGDDSTREFLADVSSFANASGGDLLYGVVDQRDAEGRPSGIPASAPGISSPNAAGEIARLENLIRDGIDPRIGALQVKSIDGFERGPAILFRIGKSWASPHMVKFKNLSRFYSRNSTGKYQLDVREVRAAFALSESLPSEIRRFRQDRLAQIVAGGTPVVLSESAKLVLHIIPASSMDRLSRNDVAIPASQQHESLRPMSGLGYRWRFNFDGLLTHHSDNDPQKLGWGYVQVFRSGAVEVVDTYELTPITHDKGEYRIIGDAALENKIILTVERITNSLKHLAAELPLFVLITFLGVTGYHLPYRPKPFSTPYDVDRDSLVLPEIVVGSYEEPIDMALRPAFDIICQAAGGRGSANYGEDGRWFNKDYPRR